IVLTRNKGEQKVYRRYSGYPGGLKETSFNEMIEKHPERVIEAAVRGMLPKSRLGRAQIKKLKIYAGPEHKHDAQNPQPLEI
ncbi:MAG: 50S ribosomal protein L13, partial [Candidatus Omnitrophica bacterium]|nr:50S ribosomal protein L13 [Candidatus Omnitrophota bacterium]